MVGYDKLLKVVNQHVVSVTHQFLGAYMQIYSNRTIDFDETTTKHIALA